LVLSLLLAMQVLETENRELRERLTLHSGNSSRPPSSDPPRRERPSPPPSLDPDKKKEAGGQPGHPGVTHRLLPVTAVKTVKDYRPAHCGQCGHPLSGEDAAPRRHQVTEMPPVVAEVVEHRRHTLLCPRLLWATVASYGQPAQ
jgi:transposase